MASILDRYGIKEVADVTFYSWNDKGEEIPVLYLDTLKVSTIEQTASSSDARGGKGNAKLLSWDFDKEINVTLEDALFSPKSLSIMYGQNGAVDTTILTQPGSQEQIGVQKTLYFLPTAENKWDTFPKIAKDPNGAGYILNMDKNATQHHSDVVAGSCTWYDETGASVTTDGTNPEEGKRYMCVFRVKVSSIKTIKVDAAHFPGTYKIVGDTYARNDATGQDEFFQFIIYKAKVSPENSITLQADGDPSTFSMNLTVLRNPEGKMMDLIQYTI